MSFASFGRAGIAVLLLAGAAGCGKRGDPLPPLRPFPAAAEGLTVRQVGNLLRLEWRAPARNSDGTTEKLDLAEVEIRRRVVDIDALVEAQTEPYEPPELEPEPDTEDSTDPEDAAEGELAEPEEVPESEEEPPPEPEPSGAQDPTATLDPDPDAEESDMEEEDLGPVLPPIPLLVIPDFAPESRPVTVLPSTVPDEVLRYEEEIDPEWVGKRVEYAVVYVNEHNRRGPRSSVAQVEPVPPLPAPGAPSAEAGDGFVLVTWGGVPVPPAEPEDPEADPDEAPEPPHYAVFRKLASDEAYPDRPVSPLPTSSLELRDRQAPFDVEVCYVVRTVSPPPRVEPSPLELAEEAGAELSAELERAGVELPADLELPESLPETALEEDLIPVEIPEFIVPEVPPITPAPVESLPSEEACLLPVDRFALPAPAGLVAVATEDSVLLTWDDSDRPDARGYHVYRGSSESEELQRITDEVVSSASFTDTDVSPGTEYVYAVTVVDDAKTPNESPRSAPSRVRFQAR